MEVARVEGLDIAYERAGEGVPLVLLHGGASDGRMWQPQLAALADEFDVIAWDQPGAGRSSDLPDGFALADYADCLASLVDTVAGGPAHVAGLSWGGTLALELYRRRPELVATLVLVDTYAGWKGSLPEEEVRARVEYVLRSLEAPHVESDAEAPGMFAAGPPPAYVPLLRQMAADVRPASARRDVHVMAETDQRDLLPHVRVPTLLVWGERDERSPLRVAHELERAIPDASLVVIPGAGHVVNLERPDEVNDAVRDFCRAHPPRSRPTG